MKPRILNVDSRFLTGNFSQRTSLICIITEERIRSSTLMIFGHHFQPNVQIPLFNGNIFRVVRSTEQKAGRSDRNSADWFYKITDNVPDKYRCWISQAGTLTRLESVIRVQFLTSSNFNLCEAFNIRSKQLSSMTDVILKLSVPWWPAMLNSSRFSNPGDATWNWKQHDILLIWDRYRLGQYLENFSLLDSIYIRL